MRDRIILPDVPLVARVGCTEDERREPQGILVDLDLLCDVSAAAGADSIELAIDYVRVREAAVEVAGDRPYALVETIAESIATRLLARFPLHEVLVRVRKPSALAEFGVPWAGVEVRRSRDA